MSCDRSWFPSTLSKAQGGQVQTEVTCIGAHSSGIIFISVPVLVCWDGFGAAVCVAHSSVLPSSVSLFATRRINAFLPNRARMHRSVVAKIHDWKNRFSAKLILEALQRKPGQVSCRHGSGRLLRVGQCQHPCCSKGSRKQSCPGCNARRGPGNSAQQRRAQRLLQPAGSAEKPNCKISMRPKC